MAVAPNCKELPALRTARSGEMEKVFTDGCDEVGDGGLLEDKPPQLNRAMHRPDRTRRDTT